MQEVNEVLEAMRQLKRRIEDALESHRDPKTPWHKGEARDLAGDAELALNDARDSAKARSMAILLMSEDEARAAAQRLHADFVDVRTDAAALARAAGKLPDTDPALFNDEVKAIEKHLESVAARLQRPASTPPTAMPSLAAVSSTAGESAMVPFIPVRLERNRPPATPEQALWSSIRANQLTFKKFAGFMEDICQEKAPSMPDEDCGKAAKERALRARQLMLPFPGIEAYSHLRAATEVFMLTNCGAVLRDRHKPGMDMEEERERLGFPEAIGFEEWQLRVENYFRPLQNKPPYLYDLIGMRFEGLRPARSAYDPGLFACLEEMASLKLRCPCLIELIWSYWLEEGMLVQAMTAIALRFQNRRVGNSEAMTRMQIDPLRPLSSLLWGYIQNDQHRLSIARRAYEYDHQYGIALEGKVVPKLDSADSRSSFLPAFHGLLFKSLEFYRAVDDTSRIADAFPVLASLAEVHQVASDGSDNQAGDLTWNARLEMFLQQWILGRPEMRELFPGRTTTLYQEPWMYTVDSVKSALGLGGLGDTSVVHFQRLASFGELLLLSVRFFPWSHPAASEASAANWALYWRKEIQGYVQAYRAVTGVDLGAEISTVAPSRLLRERMQAGRG